jgi:hypothetical protein
MATLRWLPGANHLPISDDPSAVAAHMLAFLHQATRPDDHLTDVVVCRPPAPVGQ